MYMTPAITVAILAFAVGLQAQPLNYDDAAITARSAQPEAYPEAYPDAYADAELEARMNSHVGDFVKGAVGGMAANAVANHYGHGTSNTNAALMGGAANIAAHSEHLQHAGQRLSNSLQRLIQRDTEAVLYQLAIQRRSQLRNALQY
ncbi:hypothetical protein MMC26_003620 [Xylographa opegraphella]|nr:hypothetical protein [Xylographa opegraphella]